MNLCVTCREPVTKLIAELKVPNKGDATLKTAHGEALKTHGKRGK